MGIQNLLVYVVPALFVVGALRFARVGARAQVRPVLLGWLVPGLGHYVAGFRARALFFGVQICGLFLAGLALADFRCVSPFDRHPIYGVVQMPGGLLTILSTVLTAGLRLESDDPDYPVGALYVAVACLLNVVALCDLYDLTAPKPAAAGDAAPTAAEGAPSP